MMRAGRRESLYDCAILWNELALAQKKGEYMKVTLKVNSDGLVLCQSLDILKRYKYKVLYANAIGNRMMYMYISNPDLMLMIAILLE